MESAENETERQQDADEVEPEDFENDPAREPDSKELKDIKGG